MTINEAFHEKKRPERDDGFFDALQALADAAWGDPERIAREFLASRGVCGDEAEAIIAEAKKGMAEQV